jgi:chitinase
VKFATCFLISAIFLLGFDVVSVHAQPQGKRIIGYYPSWGIYARDYHVADIPADLVTHINYAFANIVDGRIALGDFYADVDRFYPGDSWDTGALRGCFHQLQILKAAHPEVRTLISVGGWTWSGNFSDVALTVESRHIFARSCAEFVNQYQFDGLDIDWEYCVSGGAPGITHRPEDRHNFTELMRDLRWQLDSLGVANHRTYDLSFAAPANPGLIANLEVDSLYPVCDWINVMTYDFHGPWGPPADSLTGFNAPLYADPLDPCPEPYHSAFNLAAAVQAYLDLGVPSHKLNPGLAFYGRGYGNVANTANGLYAAYSHPAPFGTWENGVFDYTDLANNYLNHPGWELFRNAAAAVPWLYNSASNVMISYDDGVSVAAKADYVLQHDLGGAMIWELSGDRNAELLSVVNCWLSPRFVNDLTAYPAPDGGHIRLRFTARGAGDFQIYSSTVRNNDGTPRHAGMLDPNFSLAATLTADSAGIMTWTDPDSLQAYENFVVVYVRPQVR